MDYTSLIKEVDIPELVKALRMCMERTCPFCDFFDGNGCKLGGYMKITLDAAAAIEELQAEIRKYHDAFGRLSKTAVELEQRIAELKAAKPPQEET